MKLQRFFRGFLLVIGACSAAAHAQDNDDVNSRYKPTPAVEYAGGVRSLRDVAFTQLSGFRPLTMDLYLPPAGGAPKPVVVFVHGGAWRHRTGRDGGTFRDFPAVLASVAARGYVVASVDYRLFGEARFPGPVHDVGMAIRWLRSHASEYNIDPTSFVAWGSSAGGQIASLVGLACGVAELEPPMIPGAEPPAPSPCVQGVIDWYGLVDLESHAADLGKPSTSGVNKLIENYLGCELSKCPAGLARSASPVTYIDAKDPPFLIQHGTADLTVAANQSQRLHDKLRAAGVSSELVLYPNVSHGFSKVPDGGPDDAINQQALTKVFQFLERLFPPAK